MRRLSRRLRYLSCALLATSLTGLITVGVGWSRTEAGTRAQKVISVTERDFRIKAPASIATGRVRLHIRNLGPDTHELIVARLRGRQLPLRADGLTVDEEALEPLHPVVVEGMERGKGTEVSVDLPPGRYELFCNMAGHYLSGMHRTLVVR
jgi:uncharacterized cupredoxin-like copper-binding protein